MDLKIPNARTEERRVGKKCKKRWRPRHNKKKKTQQTENGDVKENADTTTHNT